MVLQKTTIDLDDALLDAIDEQAKQKGLDRTKYIRQILQDIVFKKPVKVTKIFLELLTFILLFLCLSLLIFIYLRS